MSDASPVDDLYDEPYADRPPPRRRSGGRRAVIAVLGFFVLLVVLAIMVLPLLSVRSNGESARADLTASLNALQDGNLEVAQERAASARQHADSASSAAGDWRTSVIGALPVAGGAVDDVRHIVDALDQAVSIDELGIQVYPDVLGGDASLVQGDAVDLSALASVTDVAAQVKTHLAAAHTALDAVVGATPLIGGPLTDARDAALKQIVPIEDAITRYQPVLDVLPSLLGTEGTRTYLVAVMNPAELRMSGGATLSLAPLTFDQGKLTFGEAGNTYDLTDDNQDISWTPVPGNPWHASAAQQLPLVNATFSPNWTTSAEELLRAWEATSGEKVDALIAIDLPAIAKLFKITGPVQVPKYGELNAQNFVKTLAGSYDKYPQAEQRRELNASIIPVLREKVFEGGKFAQKAQSLLESADERRFVMYFRDPTEQAAMSDLGATGDLSTTPGDYVGVFTQNTNASKVDYWTQRTIARDVTVNADGSATVNMTVTFDNATPPFTRPGSDTERGYFTRWSTPFVVAYLPMGAQVGATTLDGAPVDVPALTERDRPLAALSIRMEPETTHVVTYAYTVPAAATISGSLLTYTLDIDPQAMVNPTDFRLEVHLPAGYAASDLPDGWEEVGGAYAYRTDLGLESHLVLTATKS